jgi:hypothetical protein
MEEPAPAPCKHTVLAMLGVLDRIRRELRSGMRCSEIIAAVEEELTGHSSCAACDTAMTTFRREFVPLTDTVLPGDAHDSYIRIARRHGIKPAGA